MQTLSQQYCGMLKKISNKAAGDAHTASVHFSPALPQARQDALLPVGYVEDVCEPRMQLGMGRALARLGSGGCNGSFFSNPLEEAHEL
jgi:hypothetical protein